MSYGNAVKVPEMPASGPLMCTYFVGAMGGPNTTLGTCAVRHLFDYEHIKPILMTIWPNQYPFAAPTKATNRTIAVDGDESYKSRLAIEGIAEHTIRNATVEDINLTAYYCRPRHPIMWHSVTGGGSAKGITPFWYLSNGFANRGIDGATTNHNDPDLNTGMFNQEYSPFDSVDFTEEFKILKVKKVKITPSNSKKFVIKGRHFMDPTKLFRHDNNQVTWQAQAHKYHYHGKEQFILFKLDARIGSIGVAAATPTPATDVTQTEPMVNNLTKFRYTAKVISIGAGLAKTIYLPTQIVPPTGGVASIIVPDGNIVGTQVNA